MGVLLNANRLKQRLEVEAPQAHVKAILDSSWQLDLPYAYLCADNSSCFIHKIFNASIE